MLKFTIRHLMIGIAGIAVVFWSFRTPLLYFFLSLGCSILGFVAWRRSRRRPGLAGWGFALSAAWASLSIGTIYVLLPYLNDMRGAAMFFASLPFIPLAACFGFDWIASQEGRPSMLRSVLVVSLLIAIPFSMFGTSWPLRLAFYLSSPALNRLADRVAAGGRIGASEWAGPYRVSATRRSTSPAYVYLMMDPNLSGPSGFLRMGPADPIHSRGGRESLGGDGPHASRWSYHWED